MSTHGQWRLSQTTGYSVSQPRSAQHHGKPVAHPTRHSSKWQVHGCQDDGMTRTFRQTHPVLTDQSEPVHPRWARRLDSELKRKATGDRMPKISYTLLYKWAYFLSNTGSNWPVCHIVSNYILVYTVWNFAFKYPVFKWDSGNLDRCQSLNFLKFIGYCSVIWCLGHWAVHI